MNKTTIERLKTIQVIYKLKSMSLTIDFILKSFLEQNESELKREHEKSFNEFLATKKVV